VAATTIIGAASLAVRSAKGRAILTLLTLAAGSKGCHVNAPLVQTRIHSSEYSRGNHYGRTHNPIGAPASLLAGQLAREHGTMDTGTTVCTSGREKLFPRNCISNWHPNIKVEVASGAKLPVKFVGAMALKLRPKGTTSSKKFVTVSVPGSLYVPDMPVTLISTKSLFSHCGIRTYFNDELVMVLPDGTRIEFVETRTNYTVAFVGDTEQIVAMRTPTREPPAPHCHDSRVTLRNPLPLTWDLCHERFCHFNPERISASQEFVKGIDIASLGKPSRHAQPCIHCIRGAFRGHRRGHRTPGKYTRFAQRIYSDSCAMPKSTPFGFTEMYIFYDACTKYIALYFGKTTQAWEMLLAFNTFIADHLKYMPKGRVEEWVADGGPEFKTNDTETFVAEMHTRRQFIAPWNPCSHG